MSGKNGNIIYTGIILRKKDILTCFRMEQLVFADGQCHDQEKPWRKNHMKPNINLELPSDQKPCAKSMFPPMMSIDM